MINTLYREICKVGSLKIGVLMFLKQTSSAEYTKYKPSKTFKRYICQSGDVALTYAFPTFIVIDYTMASGTYIKDHKLFIMVNQIFKLERFLKRTLRIVEDPENKLYYLDADRGNRLCMYSITKETMKTLITREGGFSGNHILQSYPTIVTDYQDKMYEGVTICIDRRDNTVNLSTDELSSLYYIISRTDFITLGQAMLNSTLIWTDKAITKHLDIDTSRSADYRQKTDISAEEVRREQPATQMGINPFANLPTKGE